MEWKAVIAYWNIVFFYAEQLFIITVLDIVTKKSPLLLSKNYIFSQTSYNTETIGYTVCPRMGTQEEKNFIIYFTTKRHSLLKVLLAAKINLRLKKNRTDVQGGNKLGKYEHASREKYHYLLLLPKIYSVSR